MASDTSTIEYLNEDLELTDKPLYVRKTLKPKKMKYSYFIQKEVRAMRKLEGYDIAPKLVAYGDSWILMTYVGKRVNKSTLPKDWKTQIENILKVLKKVHISHNDIQSEEILVMNNKLRLIDFQHWTAGRKIFEKRLSQGKILQSVKLDDRTALYQCLENLK